MSIQHPVAVGVDPHADTLYTDNSDSHPYSYALPGHYADTDAYARSGNNADTYADAG